MVASLHVCGSVLVAQLWLKISRSLQVAVLHRWVNISFVIASGPGDFFAFSCLSADCSSLNVKSELLVHALICSLVCLPFPLLHSCFTLVLLGDWDVAYFFIIVSKIVCSLFA